MTSLDTTLAIWSAVGIVALATLGILGASIHRKYRNDELRAWASQTIPKKKIFISRDLMPPVYVIWDTHDQTDMQDFDTLTKAKEFVKQRLQDPEYARTTFAIYSINVEARTEVPVLYRAP